MRKLEDQLALEHNIACVIPLGDDADECFAVHHGQRSNVILGHFSDSIEHRRIRTNGADFSTPLIAAAVVSWPFAPPSPCLAR